MLVHLGDVLVGVLRILLVLCIYYVIFFFFFFFRMYILCNLIIFSNNVSY